MVLLVHESAIDLTKTKVEVFIRSSHEDNYPGYSCITHENDRFCVQMYYGAMNLESSSDIAALDDLASRRKSVLVEVSSFSKAMATIFDFWEMRWNIGKPVNIGLVEDYTDVITNMYRQVYDNFAVFIKVRGGCTLHFNVAEYSLTPTM